MEKKEERPKNSLDLTQAVGGLPDGRSKATMSVVLQTADGQSDMFIIQRRRNIADTTLRPGDYVRAPDLGLLNKVPFDTLDSMERHPFSLEAECPGGIVATETGPGKWGWIYPVAGDIRPEPGGAVLGLSIYTAKHWRQMDNRVAETGAEWKRKQALRGVEEIKRVGGKVSKALGK